MTVKMAAPSWHCPYLLVNSDWLTLKTLIGQERWEWLLHWVELVVHSAALVAVGFPFLDLKVLVLRFSWVLRTVSPVTESYELTFPFHVDFEWRFGYPYHFKMADIWTSREGTIEKRLHRNHKPHRELGKHYSSRKQTSEKRWIKVLCFQLCKNHYLRVRVNKNRIFEIGSEYSDSDNSDLTLKSIHF